MRADGGTYALILEARRAGPIRAGRLGELALTKGTYVYVGSAFGPGGVRARVRHHQTISSAPHWHMDYLRPAVRIRQVWYSHDPEYREHEWARVFASTPGAAVPRVGFGSSDCRCASHLFFFERTPSLLRFRCRVRTDIPGHLPLRCSRS